MAMHVIKTHTKPSLRQPFQGLASMVLALVLSALTAWAAAITPVHAQTATGAEPQQAKMPAKPKAQPAQAAQAKKPKRKKMEPQKNKRPALPARPP